MLYIPKYEPYKLFDKMKQALANDWEQKKRMDMEMKLLAYKEKQRLELLAYKQSLFEEKRATKIVTLFSNTSQQNFIMSSYEHENIGNWSFL